MREAGWRGAPSAAEVDAHADAHGSGCAPWVPGVADDWRDAPKVATGLWMIRRKDRSNGKAMRAAFGWVDGSEQPHIYPLGAHDNRVWFGVRTLTNDLMETRWMKDSECRPIDMDGMAVAWPALEAG